ncbi:isocitrate lyase/PEP mutase family protein [Parasphingorhabdus cellanae]|uniref:Isocitrate lyase/phosphoenolpyruvate mutase family protein n=1 Tax=Parasphingorhabdus cellanae TaxID=2806553 RepID=A0ABX7T651_9SPHN|nr:isocitrate lyase/phosphoenolpyruvate mutase family protein [Parasphingorhabdus cellanae]QTD55602.1 isocitrate lyase/phosphoenolpyruvate mutase family protein [Parasphingorhabdus cellanae]
MTGRIQQFTELHQPGQPLVLYNIWDAGSAQATVRAGAKAVATGSLSVAGAQGFDDGEKLPFDFALTNARHIVSAVDVPVTVDLETGYGDSAAAVGANAQQMKDVGVAGLNLEDQDFSAGGLRDVSAQADRIKVAADTGLFINARTDLFIQTPIPDHDGALAQKALERCQAYADAGAGSFFVPFAISEKLIGDICAKAKLPINVMMMPDSPSTLRLAELGVARISYGPGPWMAAMSAFEAEALKIFES